MKSKKKPHANKKPYKKVQLLHKSIVGSPVKYAWEVFSWVKDHLGDKFTRKAAIETAVKKGVAFYTARTQYQAWREAGDRDRATHEKLYGAGNPHIKQ
jgi:hypothetical protein